MAERIGSLLVRRGLLTPAELEEGLRAQLIYGGRLGSILVELDLLSLDELADALSEQLRYPVATQAQLDAAPPAAVKLLTPEQAEAHQAFPFGLEGRKCRMAMAAPHDPAIQDALAFITGLRILPFLVPELRLAHVLQQRYGIQRKEHFIRLAPQRLDHGRRRSADASMEQVLAGAGAAREEKESLFGSLGGDQFLTSEEDDPSVAPAAAIGGTISFEEEPPELEITAEEEEAELAEIEVEPAEPPAPASQEKVRPSEVVPSPAAVTQRSPAEAEPPAPIAELQPPPAAAQVEAPAGVPAAPVAEAPQPYAWSDEPAEPSRDDTPRENAGKASAPQVEPPPAPEAPAVARAPLPPRPPSPPGRPVTPYPPPYRAPLPAWQGAYPPPPPWAYPPPPPWAQPPVPPRGWSPPPPPTPVIRSRHPNNPDRLFDEDTLDSWSLRSDDYALIEEIRPPAELEEAVARLHGHRRERAHQVEPLERADFWEFLPWSQPNDRALEVETDGRTREVPPLDAVAESCRFEGDGAHAIDLEGQAPPARPWHEVGLWVATGSLAEEPLDAGGPNATHAAAATEALDVEAAPGPVPEGALTASGDAAPAAGAFDTADPTAVAGDTIGSVGVPEAIADTTSATAPKTAPDSTSAATPDAPASDAAGSSVSGAASTTAPDSASPTAPDAEDRAQSAPAPEAIADGPPATASDAGGAALVTGAERGSDERASDERASDERASEAGAPPLKAARSGETEGGALHNAAAADAASSDAPGSPASEHSAPAAGASPEPRLAADWSLLIPDAGEVLASLRQRLDAAREPAAVSEALLDYCAPRFGRGFILVESEGTAKVWRGFGPGSDDPELALATLALEGCGPLQEAVRSPAPLRLPTGGLEAEEELAVRLRAQSPYQVLAAVRCGERPVAFVYAECPVAPLASDAASELQQVVELASEAHARLQASS